MFQIISLSNNITSSSLIIAVAGYVIVFASLMLLFLFFQYLPRLLNYKPGKKFLKKNGSAAEKEKQILGEETAAVAIALHLFFDEIHDEESGVLTIKKISKAYSPWSSKIYAVRNQFNRI